MKSNRDFFDTVIKPRLIQMTIDGSLPSDMNELHFETFGEEEPDDNQRAVELLEDARSVILHFTDAPDFDDEHSEIYESIANFLDGREQPTIKGTLTFATGRTSARRHQMNRLRVDEIGEDRYAVTIPIEFSCREDIYRIIEGIDEDIIETFTVKDANGNDLWTEDDFE